MNSVLESVGPETLAEVVPLLRRALDLDAEALARLRGDGQVLTTFVRLPFEVMAARAVPSAAQCDATYAAADVLAWSEGLRLPLPARDGDWRGAAPPASGWTRVEMVPDTELRPLVRSGALALKGLSGHASQALLDSVVLTVSSAEAAAPVEVTLRMLSALTRMGFLPRGGSAAIDVNGRWKRLVAQYGTIYAEPSGLGLL